jgi:hypothetical protein
MILRYHSICNYSFLFFLVSLSGCTGSAPPRAVSAPPYGGVRGEVVAPHLENRWGQTLPVGSANTAGTTGVVDGLLEGLGALPAILPSVPESRVENDAATQLKESCRIVKCKDRQ